MIYFIELQCSEKPIKIGHSSDVSHRMLSFTRLPWPIAVLATMQGTPTEELILHQRFRAFRMHGEWFRDAPEIREFIALHASPWTPPQPVQAPVKRPFYGHPAASKPVDYMARLRALK